MEIFQVYQKCGVKTLLSDLIGFLAKEGVSMKYLMLAVVSLVAIIGGCAHVMSEASLATVDRSIQYPDIAKTPEALVGKKVLIGGVIAENRSSGDLMQLEVAQLELLSNGVPDEASHSSGRFLLISGELFEPLIYRRGSLVTVIGEIKGQQIKKLEGADYRYPLISAKEIRLFRTSEFTVDRPTNPYQNQFGDEKFMLRPPGSIEGEFRRP